MPRTIRDKNGLTPLQKRFVEEYMVDLNGARAAKRAGYSKKSAQAISTQQLLKPAVRTAVDKAMAQRSKKVQVNADWVLNELVQQHKEIKAINRLNPKDIYYETGELKPIHEWPEVWQQKRIIRQIESIELKTRNSKTRQMEVIGYLKRIMSPELDALEMQLSKTIGQHVQVGAFKENTIQQGNITLVIEYVEPSLRLLKSPITRPNGKAEEEPIDI